MIQLNCVSRTGHVRYNVVSWTTAQRKNVYDLMRDEDVTALVNDHPDVNFFVTEVDISTDVFDPED